MADPLMIVLGLERGDRFQLGLNSPLLQPGVLPVMMKSLLKVPHRLEDIGEVVVDLVLEGIPSRLGDLVESTFRIPKPLVVCRRSRYVTVTRSSGIPL